MPRRGYVSPARSLLVDTVYRHRPLSGRLAHPEGVAAPLSVEPVVLVLPEPVRCGRLVGEPVSPAVEIKDLRGAVGVNLKAGP